MKVDEVRRLELTVGGNGLKVLRSEVRRMAIEVGFGIVDQTRLVTAASEIGRNTQVHGEGGTVVVQSFEDEGRKGLRLIFEDDGPGIADLELAMSDGYSTGSGMGLGLGGSSRLVDEIRVERKVPGTVVTLLKWVSP